MNSVRITLEIELEDTTTVEQIQELTELAEERIHALTTHDDAEYDMRLVGQWKIV